MKLLGSGTPSVPRALRGLSWPALGLAVALAPAPASAQPADKALEDALAAMAKGDTKTACPAFRTLYEQKKDVRALVNVAECDERDGKLVAAREHWRLAESQLASSFPALKDRAVEKARALDERIPTLSLVAPAGFPKDATIQLDGRAVQAAVVPLDPGDHTVTVDAPGHEPWSTTIKLAERARSVVDLQLGKKRESGAPPPPPPAEKGGGPSGLLVAGLVVTGLGVVGVGTFAVTGGLVLDKQSQFAAACPNRSCAPGSEGARIAEEGKTLNAVNAVGLVVGIVGLGAGITMAVVGASQKPKTAARVRWLGAGLAVEGSF